MDSIREQLARRIPRTAKRIYVHHVKSGAESGVYVGSADKTRADDTKIEDVAERRRVGALAVAVVKTLQENPWHMASLPPHVTGEVETHEMERTEPEQAV